MKIKRISISDWDRQVKEARHATPFHQIYWHNVLESTFSDLSIEYFAIEQSGKPTGLIPIFKRKRFGMKLYGSPLRGMFTSYLGMVSEDGDDVFGDAILNRL